MPPLRPAPSATAAKPGMVRRLAVCLFPSHPLVSSEFDQRLDPARFVLQTVRPEVGPGGTVDSSRLPEADVYVVDTHAPRPVTESLVAGIFARFPQARVITLADEFGETNAFPLLRLGAKGLVTYAQAPGQIPQALEAVANGGYWVPRPLLSRFVDSIISGLGSRQFATGTTQLSKREKEVLDLLLENISNKEIAQRLHISERTAKFHVSNLLAKFSVRRRADLIVLWFQNPPAAG